MITHGYKIPLRSLNMHLNFVNPCIGTSLAEIIYFTWFNAQPGGFIRIGRSTECYGKLDILES